MSLPDRLGLPWFEPSSTPYRIHPVQVDDSTTPRQLALRTIWAPRRFVLPAALLSVGHQIGEAMVPVLAGLAIDRAIGRPDFGGLMMWLALLALDFAVLSLSYRFGSRIGWIGMHSVRHQLRMRVAGRLLDPRGTRDGDRLPGVSMSIAGSDVDRLSLTVALGIYPLGQLAGVLLTAVILLSISWPLGLGVLIGVPTLLFLLDRAGEPLRRRSGTEQQMAAAAAGRAADLMGGYRIIKGVRGEQQAESRYRRSSRESLGATLHARRVYGGYLGLVSALTGLFIAVIGTAAGYLTVTGEVSIAELVTIAGLTQFLIGPVQALSSYFGSVWSRGLASAERILMVLRDEPEHRGERELPAAEAPAEIQVRGPGGELTVQPGELVVVRADATAAADLFGAIAGGDGAAAVRYAGVDVRELDPQQYRAQVLAVPHHAALFDGSVLQNVTLHRRTDQRGLEALDVAGYAEILTVPQDAERTEVGNEGERLSGGQRQRVSLARAVAQDPPVLALLDPTTAVDSVTEARIADGLRSARRGRSTIVITGSPAFVAIADRVVDWQA